MSDRLPRIATRIAYGGYLKHRDAAVAEKTDEAIKRLVVSIRQGLRLAGVCR